MGKQGRVLQNSPIAFEWSVLLEREGGYYLTWAFSNLLFLKVCLVQACVHECVYVLGHTCECRFLERPEKSVGYPGPGVTDGFE